MYILGISCFYHDAAAALLKNGEFVAAAEEERFTRRKHDHSFPKNAIRYCLEEAGITPDDLDYVVFHEKPFVKFERIISTSLATWPRGFWTFLKAIPLWLNQKLFVLEVIKKEMEEITKRCRISSEKNLVIRNEGRNAALDSEETNRRPKYQFKKPILFSEHHLSHAASCYLLSPFDEAAILTVDGVGEWTTTLKGFGRGREIHMTDEVKFPHSLGLLYSAFTAFLGFEVNEGEYKVMGMAPYGEPHYTEKIMKLIDVKPDGSFHLDMNYFAYHRSTTRSFSEKFVKEFGEPRKPEATFSIDPASPYYKESKYYADIAASIQKVLEEILLKIVNRLYEETAHNLGHECKNLVMAGGVALNCTANSRIIRETPFENIFIQPAAGDSGGALGAAAYVYSTILKRGKVKFDSVYLGPHFEEKEIEALLTQTAPSPERALTNLHPAKLHYEKLDDNVLLPAVAKLLNEGKVVGWFQDRMEMGPRALGNRSILANPTKDEMRDIVNEKIKHREKFRPFAPSVMAEYAAEYFELATGSSQMSKSDLVDDAKDKLLEGPYMLLIANVRQHRSLRNPIPAVTHVNGTARFQTVRREQNPRYYDLIQEFQKLTGVPVVLNTSFNVRGEPIVCTPEEAYNCFMKTDMDALVLENFLILKKQ